jgi:hypothetical protein
MRVASWLVTLTINLAFGLGAASDLDTVQSVRAAAHPAIAQGSCPLAHRTKATHPVSPGHYLAAVRMGWAIG